MQLKTMSHLPSEPEFEQAYNGEHHPYKTSHLPYQLPLTASVQSS